MFFYQARVSLEAVANQNEARRHRLSLADRPGGRSAHTLRVRAHLPHRRGPRAHPGLNASFAIDIRGGATIIVRFVDGQFGLDPTDSGPVDCRISADPVALLMVISGRLEQSEATALGLLSAGGDHPELALGFMSLFIYP